MKKSTTIQSQPQPQPWSQVDSNARQRSRMGLQMVTRRQRIRIQYLWSWQRWLPSIGMGFLLLLLLSLSVGMGTVLTWDRFFATRVYPNVRVQGVAMGQMTRTEALRALHRHYADFLQHPVTLAYGGMTWQPALDDLGIEVGFDAAVQQALTAGKHAERKERVRTGTAIWRYGLDIPLQVTVNQATMQRYLVTHLAPITRSAVDARLVIDGVQSSVSPARAGRQALIDATVQDVTVAVQGLEPRTIAVRTRPLAPMISDRAAEKARQSVATLLQSPLVLAAGERTWEWTLTDLVPLVEVQRVPSLTGPGDALVVRVDRAQIRKRLQPVQNATRERGVYPRVNWNGGDLRIFRAGTPGRQVDVGQAEQMIVDALWSSDRTIALPFEEVPVPTTAEDLAQLGIRELISVGRTDFSDSEDYRITNIVAGMRLLHGVLIAPGEEFSFNETIGSIGEENGFVPGWAIVEGGIQQEWGGGICQDSTTMMRAAFWAGLPITERWNHSQYLPWYNKYGYGEYGDGPGIDSTIFLGGVDLRFVNDTDAWILIQAYANVGNSLAEIRFYGTRGGRTVELAGQPTISYSPNGRIMDVAFTRVVKENGVEVYRKTYWSTFRRW